MMFYPIHAINVNISLVTGHSDVFLRLVVIKWLLMLGLLAIAIPFGTYAIASSELAWSVICLYINAKYNGELIGYSWIDQFKDIAPIFLISLTAAALAWGISLFPIPSLWAMLLLQIAVAVVSYLFFCRFFKLGAYAEVHNIIMASGFLRKALSNNKEG
jgi:hypothetical protein